MNIDVSSVRGREGVRDLQLGVLEECDVCINNISMFNDAASLWTLYWGISLLMSLYGYPRYRETESIH